MLGGFKKDREAGRVEKAKKGCAGGQPLQRGNLSKWRKRTGKLGGFESKTRD